jgi:hypothetical protein
MAEQDVSAGGTVDAAEEASGQAHPHDGTAVVGAAGEEFTGDGDVAVDDDAVQAAQRQGAFGRLGYDHLEAVVV